MNKHILFVMDHLANPGKYTQEELEIADDAADAADAAAADAAAAYAYASYATAIATTAAAAASYAATAADDVYAASYMERWVNRYFCLTSENKQDYIDALTTDKVTL